MSSRFSPDIADRRRPEGKRPVIPAKTAGPTWPRDTGWVYLRTGGVVCQASGVFAHRFPVQTDLVGAVHEAVEDAGGRGAVVIEDLRPLLECAMGGNDGGAVLVALPDDLGPRLGAVGEGVRATLFNRVTCRLPGIQREVG